MQPWTKGSISLSLGLLICSVGGGHRPRLVCCEGNSAVREAPVLAHCLVSVSSVIIHCDSLRFLLQGSGDSDVGRASGWGSVNVSTWSHPCEHCADQVRDVASPLESSDAIVT